MLDQLLQENTLLDEGWKDVYNQFVETGKVPEDTFQEFRSSDPSGTNKYLLWMCKQYISNPDRARHIIDVVNLFHQQVTRKLLKDKDADIYQHDLESADKAAQEAAQKVSRAQKRKEEKSQSVIVDETDDYLIVVPESHKASCFYGANTKWCISGRTASYWNQYYRRGVKIYIIVDKKQNKKYALAVYRDGTIEAYNEQDNQIELSTIEKAIGVDFLADIAKPVTKQELSKRAKVQIQKVLDSCTKNPDGTYSADEDVDLSDLNLKRLPVRFKEVKGDFYCDSNQLTTLEGAPQEVGGGFFCDNNQLTTLKGAPQEVGGYFDCSHNQLTTLEGAPRVVGGYFDCSHNQLTTFEGAPQKVGGDFRCNWNPVPPSKLKKTVSRPYLSESRGHILLDEGWKDVYNQFVKTNKVPEDVFQEFRRSDPSGTGKYIQWMCKQYISNPERARHIIDVVQLFHQQVTRKLLKGDDADIYRHDLESADKAAQEAAQKTTKTQKRKKEKSESIIVAETDDYLIVVPESHKASCFYGANTKWCISARTANYWNQYYRNMMSKIRR